MLDSHVARAARTGHSPEYWNRIRRTYAQLMPRLLAAPRDEWAFDAYFWSNGMVNMTPIEYWIWAEFREINAIVYPQFPVANVFVDFANPAAKVAIECDGAEFHQDREKDRLRDERLQALGWTVHRIPGWACARDTNPDTGRLGEAAVFVRRVALQHRITRGGGLLEMIFHQLQRHDHGDAIYDDEY